MGLHCYFHPCVTRMGRPIAQLILVAAKTNNKLIKTCWVSCKQSPNYIIRVKTFNRIWAEWRCSSVSALPCERLRFASWIRFREIIPASHCTMGGQNNWGSPALMKLWVAWEVLRWLVKCRGLVSWGFIAKYPEGLDSDRWIALRGGARIPRGL